MTKPPADQPYMFQPDGLHIALGRDLAREGKPSTINDLTCSMGGPLMGDKGNDENMIASRLQGGFLNFQNAPAGEMLKQSPPVSFDDIQRVVRQHDQLGRAS